MASPVTVGASAIVASAVSEAGLEPPRVRCRQGSGSPGRSWALLTVTAHIQA